MYINKKIHLLMHNHSIQIYHLTAWYIAINWREFYCDTNALSYLNIAHENLSFSFNEIHIHILSSYS